MATIRTILASLAAAALTCGSPAFAQDGGVDEGQPGASEGATPFQFDEITVPTESDSGVFIAQIGSTNRATVQQQGARAHARIAQSGEDNSAELTQGDGAHDARIAQDGTGNGAAIVQEGNQTVLMLAQQGAGNRADISQTEAGALLSAAAISQSGSGNLLNLVQDGSDNQARLVQEGDGNTMTATQLGNGNRLAWTQQGDGLSDLQITQDGGQAMQITQTNGGGN